MSNKNNYEKCFSSSRDGKMSDYLLEHAFSAVPIKFVINQEPELTPIKENATNEPWPPDTKLPEDHSSRENWENEDWAKSNSHEKGEWKP
jgi:hypothetical protein